VDLPQLKENQMSTRNLTGAVRTTALTLLAATAIAAQPAAAQDFVGAVYAMTNEFDGNQIVTYGRNADGTIELIESVATGGNGAAFDGGEGLDPLISANSIIPVTSQRAVLAVNAGSNTITSFRIQDDFTLTRRSERTTDGIGPNSIAYSNGIVYVSNIDSDGLYNGEPDQEGSISGFRLNGQARLERIPGSTRELGNRPAGLQFSPDGKFLVVSSINAGSSALASGSIDEIVVYAIGPNGQISETPVSAATSTLPFNAEDRNLPSAIGFEIVEEGGSHYVVVTEAREFQSDGSPPEFDLLQTGSVSTWQLTSNGSLIPINLDVPAGDLNDGQRTACWLDFSADGDYFWVSNALESTLSTYSFDAGQIELVEEVAAAGTPPSPDDPFGTTDGWIDLWTSRDGQYLYQLFGLDGTIGVYAIDGPNLTLVQEVSGDLPEENTQGIIAF